ncbi:MAG: M3 family metallopeptidase [Prevotellaceae bacterium]|jgi:peptidyl-dipeptidase Dcp|nr:M3 family metallopeptidase [Prevotellaceae bacterium]
MKKTLLMIMTVLLLAGCGEKEGKNPFYSDYSNKFGAPPFEEIKVEHYLPAFKDGIKQAQEEIDLIADNADAPTFANTIEALDYSGELLTKVSSVFSNLQSADTNDELDAVAKEVSPLLSEHSDNIYMNVKLFARVKALYETKDELGLNGEQARLLDKYYKQFVQSGANLNDEQKIRLREINKELSALSLAFGQNVTKETGNYKKIIENEDELIGLPESVKQAAAEEAGEVGKWAFTTQKSSWIPVLQYSENRELRKELLLAYTNRADQNNEFDNKEIVNKIMKLRIERAQMMGYDNPAQFILENTMAKTPAAVMDFLHLLWAPSLRQAKAEVTELQKMMDAEGKGEKLEAWDWWFYTEKLRKEKFDLDEEAIRPYFKLENVRQGAFDLAGKLWGLQFRKLMDMPIYHPDVEAFEVSDTNGSLIGIFYTDYFPRKGKKVGAWMSSFREQYKKEGVDHRPIVVNVCNFTKPTADTPSLLTMDEVTTLFHEFGHALHGLLSQCTYPLLSGTNVSRDFVELPSQIMENWCFEPEMLKMYAYHYKTDEVIPDELIEKINATSTFNQGFIMTEHLSAALLDMYYHTGNKTEDVDINQFETDVMKQIGMIDEIIIRYRSTYFSHIFSGGYESGYYAYKWAEVLDADAFEAFVETGDIFNKNIAEAYRKNILEKGDTDDPMNLYLKFRGAAPSPDALLKKSGLK